MSLSTIINNAVNQAFEAADDLVKLATLDNEETTSYDFSTGTLVSTSDSVSVSVVVIKTSTGENSELMLELIAKSSEFDYSKYSKLTIDGVQYEITSIEKVFDLTMITVRSR